MLSKAFVTLRFTQTPVRRLHLCILARAVCALELLVLLGKQIMPMEPQLLRIILIFAFLVLLRSLGVTFHI